jgi:hypothetical protein
MWITKQTAEELSRRILALRAMSLREILRRSVSGLRANKELCDERTAINVSLLLSSRNRDEQEG